MDYLMGLVAIDGLSLQAILSNIFSLRAYLPGVSWNEATDCRSIPEFRIGSVGIREVADPLFSIYFIDL